MWKDLLASAISKMERKVATRSVECILTEIAKGKPEKTERAEVLSMYKKEQLGQKCKNKSLVFPRKTRSGVDEKIEEYGLQAHKN